VPVFDELAATATLFDGGHGPQLRRAFGSTAMASIETSRPWGRRTWAGAERAGGGSAFTSGPPDLQGARLGETVARYLQKHHFQPLG